eukprot:42092_1
MHMIILFTLLVMVNSTVIDTIEKTYNIACNEPALVGPCKKYTERYFFNSQKNECEMFMYGGCSGNSNNFKSKSECDTFANTYCINTNEESVKMGMNIERLSLLGDWLNQLVEDVRMAGAGVIIYRNNSLIYESYHGYTNIESKSKITQDTIYRLQSNTKSVTSVGLMMLYEKHKFKLYDPLSKYIPAFKKENMIGIYDYENNKHLSTDDLKSIKFENISTIPITNEIKIWHLLTHTSGLSYAFDWDGVVQPVDVLYKQYIHDKVYYGEFTSEQFANELAKMPLIFEPGTYWEYSFATDLMGRLIEVLSGQSLDEYMYENIFQPLHMDKTGFKINAVDPNENNLATLYSMNNEGVLRELDNDFLYRDDFPIAFGGMGMLSTVSDFSKFTQMLLNGGKLAGENEKRLLSSKTVDFIRMNHLPQNMDITSMLHSHSVYPSKTDGKGFGLGFGVNINLRTSDGVCGLDSIGSYYWSGGAEGYFWVDPNNNLSVVFLTQLMGGGTDGSVQPGETKDDNVAFPDFRSALSTFIYSSFTD